MGCLNSGDIDSLVGATNSQIVQMNLEKGIKSMEAKVSDGCFTYELILDDSVFPLPIAEPAKDSILIFYKALLMYGFDEVETNLQTNMAQERDIQWLGENGFCIAWDWKFSSTSESISKIEFDYNEGKWIRRGK